ncbi:hypothetical protein [Flavobacterium sp.]|uniref:hypothetical protein n=1 Tax=Flavobacterium sp. TaxID=239 RepID=UPI00262824B6|nr:hypothetical protein [Flavobacterium sp.]
MKLEKNNSKKEPQRNVLVNKYVCNFISKKWIINRVDSKGKVVTMRQYAKECNLATSTITKILIPDGYNIPLATINSICLKENVSLSKFFIEFEKEYGISIIDEFLKTKK